MTRYFTNHYREDHAGMRVHYVKMDVDLVRFLADRKVFVSPDGKPRGERWAVPENLSLEPYTAIFGGNDFITMGSFSYCTGVAPKNSSMGRYCSIGSSLAIMGYNHPTSWVTTSNLSYESRGPAFRAYVADNLGFTFPEFDVSPFQKGGVAIGNDVWIGWNVTLAQGLSIGNGSIIAGKSNVVKDVEPYTIVGGNPARVIKRRFPEEIVERFESSKWWNYEPSQLPMSLLRQPEKFLDRLDDMGLGNPYRPLPLSAKQILEEHGVP